MSKTIEVIIAPDGSTKLETKGFAGKACQDASRFLEAALGTSQSEQLTADFYYVAEPQRLPPQQSGG